MSARSVGVSTGRGCVAEVAKMRELQAHGLRDRDECFFLHSLWSALQVLIGPCMHEHNLTIIKQNTMEGSANLLKDMASGKYLGYLRWDTMTCSSRRA